MKKSSFEDLECWRAGRRLRCFVYSEHLITGNDDGLISDDLLQMGREMVDEAIRLINGYRAYVLRRLKEE